MNQDKGLLVRSLDTTGVRIYIIDIEPTAPMQSKKPSHSRHSAISDSQSPITPCDSFDRAEQTLDTAISCMILRCLSAGCYLPHCSRVFPGVCRSLAARRVGFRNLLPRIKAKVCNTKWLSGMGKGHNLDLSPATLYHTLGSHG
jgi:hypothetical protein